MYFLKKTKKITATLCMVFVAINTLSPMVANAQETETPSSAYTNATNNETSAYSYSIEPSSAYSLESAYPTPSWNSGSSYTGADGTLYSVDTVNNALGITNPVTGSTKQIQSGAAAQAIGKDNTPTEPEFGCSFDNVALNETFISGCIAMVTYYVFLVPTYKLAMLVSYLLNFVIAELVTGMGKIVNDLTSITTAWEILRNVANIFLVFLTIYVGIAIILGISKYGDKRLLWKIILAGLMINFSITITKVVIDVSNLFAVETYRQFLTTSGQDTACADDNNGITAGEKNTSNTCLNIGIAGAFWTKLKMGTIFKGASTDTAATGSADKNWALATIAFMGSFMYLVLAFSFMAAAFLLIIRFLVLVLLIILSPVAFVAWITDVSGIGSKWWKTLIDQSFFAPILLFMWYIGYIVLSSYTDKFSGDAYSKAFAGAADGTDISQFDIVLMFIIVMGFIIMGLVLAKHFGAYGAQRAISAGKWAAVGASGAIATNTLGRTSAYAQRKWTESVAKAQEMDEDGYYKDTSVRAHARRWMAGGKIDRAVNAGLGAGSSMKFGTKSSFAERKLANQKRASARQETITDTGEKAELRNAMNVINRHEELSSTEFSDTYNDAEIAKAHKTISSASQTHIEQLRAEHGNKANTQVMREAYSKKQALALANRADTTPKQKIDLVNAAYHQEQNAIATNDSQRIGKISYTDIPALKNDLTSNPNIAAKLSQKTFDQIVENKDGYFNEATIEKFKNERKTYFATIPEDEIERVIASTKPIEFANYDASFLGRPEFVQNIDTHILREMHRGGLTKEKRAALKQTVASEYQKINPAARTNIILGPGTQRNQNTLTAREKNIVDLHNWFTNENNGRPSV